MKKLFVGGLSWGTTDEGLRQAFERFGEVAEGMRAQSTGAEQIRDAMVRLADGAQRTAMALEVTASAASDLRAAVGGLDREVSRFRT